VTHIIRHWLGNRNVRGLVESDFALQIVSLPFGEAVKFLAIHVEHFAEIVVGQMMLANNIHSLITLGYSN